MDENTILENLTPIFRQVFRDEKLVVRPEQSSDDIEKWDSLSHTVMIDAVEKAFGIKFQFRDMLQMKNVGDLVGLIQKYSPA